MEIKFVVFSPLSSSRLIFFAGTWEVEAGGWVMSRLSVAGGG